MPNKNDGHRRVSEIMRSSCTNESRAGAVAGGGPPFAKLKRGGDTNLGQVNAGCP